MTEPPEKIKSDCEGNRDKCTSERCPIFGTLRKPSRDGKRRVRGCGDPVARGLRSKRKGQAKQALAARGIGVPRSALSPGHEEFFGGAVRVEIKAGKQVGPIATRYQAAKAQSDAARSVGDHRPFVFVAMPDGTKDGLVIFPMSATLDTAVALLHNLDVI